VVALLIATLALVSYRSASPANLLELTRPGAALGIVSLGQTLVLIAGGLDLSVGSVVLVTDIVASRIMAGRPENVIPATLVALAIGGFVGLLNGLLVTRIRLTPFIATLGMSLFVTGAALAYSGGISGGPVPAWVKDLGNGVVLFAPTPAILWIVIAGAIWFTLGRTKFGRHLVAAGSNRRNAHLSGVRVSQTVLMAYVLSGLCAAVGGWILLAYVGVGSTTFGTDFITSSIAASILGGALFIGGHGSVAGTVGGTLFLLVLYNVLTVANLPISGQMVAQGSIILIALALYSRTRA
jgi:ribose/xylose/arabinose/galactoside ABC-type transport system permease subunit